MKIQLNTSTEESKNTKPNAAEINDDIKSLYRKNMSIEDLLIFTTEHNCSDLYIKVFDHPYISRYGKIIKVPCQPISKDTWAKFYDTYILNELNAGYVRQKLLDTSVSIRVPEDSPNYGKYQNNCYRYRVSFGFSEERNIATFRMIKPEMPTFDTINYNPKCVEALKKAYAKPSGILYTTGPTGSGKALEKHTQIPTIKGMKELNDIQVGDMVFDKNGVPTKVIGKYHPNDEKFYEFTFSDGTKVKSADGHLWEVDLLNLWASTPFTTQYKIFFTPNTLYKLESNKESHILVDYSVIYSLIFNEVSSYTELKSFLYEFKDLTIDIANYEYIDLDVLIANCNYEDRLNRLTEYRKTKQFISNNEAKSLLKSKYIQIIRQSGLFYNSNKRTYFYLDEICSKCLEYYNQVSDQVNKAGHNITGILTTHDIVANGLINNAGRLNFAIKRPLSCQFESVNLPIKPYSLGFWLGDGIKTDFKMIKMYKEPMYRIQQDYPNTVISEQISEHGTVLYKANAKTSVTRTILKDNNLFDNKHIPEIYKIASIEDKLNLIAGLIDSDGSVDKNGVCSIGLSVYDIISDLREICCSLGFKCSDITTKHTKYKKYNKVFECKDSYILSFYPNIMLPLQVEHKKTALLNKLKSNKQQQIRHSRFYLKNIEEIQGNNEDYYCLSVESATHTFLCTSSYLPTHNSTTMAACINTFTQPDNLLDNKVLITLEDPIENIFKSTNSVKINQKELGKDFLSFDLGIKAALREHPNMIIVGECRDKEVICAAIEAARTGHVCSTTFHASDVGGTVNRLLYHLDNDKNLSMDLILQLNIILSQKMIKQDSGYLVDTQYLLFDDYVTKKLVEIIENPDANIAVEINKLIAEERLQEQGISKDWDYKELH